MKWLEDIIGWMVWTLPTALLFGGLFLTIAALGVWDRYSPSYPRKGFLPMPTTRGDRLFVGILIMIAIHIVYALAFKEASLWPATGLAAVTFATVARWG